MEIKRTEKGHILNKELNELDKFVIKFIRIMEKAKIDYVIISGYISILFGRSRSSEDVDMFISKTNFKDFVNMWNLLTKEFYCLNIEDPKEAYEEYLEDKLSIRFALPHEAIPNMEIKFATSELDIWTLQNKKEVILNGNKIYISSLELQIAFKLILGSDKDIEDSRYIYSLFKEELSYSLLTKLLVKFNKEKEFNKYIK